MNAENPSNQSTFNQSNNLVIAIDGPAGSGKSSTSKAVAQKLNYKFFSTGAVYRAATVYCLAQEVPLNDPISIECAISQMIDENVLKMNFETDNQRVFIGENEITNVLFDSKTTDSVFSVSSCIPAREILIKYQRDVINKYINDGIVVEGRDICDVVFPNATLKILLTASEQARALRRAKEFNNENAKINTDSNSGDSVRAKLHLRDLIDSQTTKFDPASKTDPSVNVIDNSELTLSETVEAILTLFDKNCSVNNS